MTSLGTDFETHAIWQGYVEDPAAKEFCSKEGPHYRFEQSPRNPTINLIHKLGNPLGIPYPSCTAWLSGAYVTQESLSLRIFVSKKGIICVCPMDIPTRNLWQKAESILL